MIVETLVVEVLPVVVGDDFGKSESADVLLEGVVLSFAWETLGNDVVTMLVGIESVLEDEVVVVGMSEELKIGVANVPRVNELVLADFGSCEYTNI